MEAFIAVGSNMGNARIQTLRALRALHQCPCFELLAWSTNYQSAALCSPNDSTPQDDYQNLVAHLYSSHTPEDLLRQLQIIEQRLGRIRNTTTVRWQPRFIDLDILLIFFQHRLVRVNSDQLRIPHPEITKRNFVLVPLMELLSRQTVEEAFGPLSVNYDGLMKSTAWTMHCVTACLNLGSMVTDN